VEKMGRGLEGVWRMKTRSGLEERLHLLRGKSKLNGFEGTHASRTLPFW